LVRACQPRTDFKQPRTLQQFEATDATFSGFLAQCIAAPNFCPAARFDSPEPSLSQQVYDTLELLKIQPIVNWSYAGNLIGYGEAKNLILTYIYGQGTDWLNLGIVVDFLLSRNTSLLSTLSPPSNMPFGPDPLASTDSIRCGDCSLRAHNLDEIRPLVGEFYNVSQLMRDYMAVLYPVTCAQWPFKAKEVYSGGFNNVSTGGSPIIFVGNMFDPIASLAGARNPSAAFPNSRVLVENWYGHSTFGQRSTCMINTISAYFLNGTVPEEDAQCQPDGGTFANPSFAGS
jgi:hypothetical protein